LRHLEKYAGAAQELEQHLEDDHPDRGDTQRSVGFYKNVAVSWIVLKNKTFFARFCKTQHVKRNSFHNLNQGLSRVGGCDLLLWRRNI
jgi:hypothetical protein